MKIKCFAKWPSSLPVPAAIKSRETFTLVCVGSYFSLHRARLSASLRRTAVCWDALLPGPLASASWTTILLFPTIMTVNSPKSQWWLHKTVFFSNKLGKICNFLGGWSFHHLTLLTEESLEQVTAFAFQFWGWFDTDTMLAEWALPIRSRVERDMGVQHWIWSAWMEVSGAKPRWGKWKRFVIVVLGDHISSALVMPASSPLGTGFSTRARYGPAVMKLYLLFSSLVSKSPAVYSSSASNQLYTPRTSKILLPSRVIFSTWGQKSKLS